MCQGSVSCRAVAVPPVQAPAPLQVSPVVQALPSLQATPDATGACWQPLVGLHVSVVQVFPSSQLSGVPLLHWPP